MIGLQRVAAPEVLVRRAAQATEELWQAWREGREPKANPAIYNHPEVKRTLREAQHHKCAYCETHNPSSHGLVEHYRPKNGWRQNRVDALQKPEYFWLAYEWENLLFACDLCNDRGHKENLFPLADPDQRATSAAPDTAGEIPLLLNPYGPLSPEDHIAWDRDVPRAREGSVHGAETIAVLRLDHDDYRSDFRRAHLLQLDRELARAERLEANNPDLPALRRDFLALLEADKPWAAMIRANLGDRIRAL